MALPEYTPPVPVPQPKSIDDLISELNVPRQDTRPPVPPPSVPGAMPGTDQPSGMLSADISDETAQTAGKQIADLIDYGSKGICGLISGNDPDKYKISNGEKSDLTNAYAAVAKRYGFGTTNPVFLAVILTLLIVGPNFREAFQDRRYNKLKEEQERLKAEQEKIKTDIAELHKEKATLLHKVDDEK